MNKRQHKFGETYSRMIFGHPIDHEVIITILVAVGLFLLAVIIGYSSEDSNSSTTQVRSPRYYDDYPEPSYIRWYPGD